MKKILYFLLISVAATIGACQDEDSELGSSLVTTSFYNVYVDTCTVDISTILMDSIETQGDTIAQIGHIKNSAWGEVSSTYYAEFSVNSFTPSTTSDYSLDSITIKMYPSGHYWGDTLTQQRVSIYAIKNAIVLEGDEGLYNINSRELEETPLTSFVYTPRPGRKREVEIRLPDSLGQKWLTDIRVEDDYFDTQEKFKREFPGLAFVPEDDGNCITGFSVGDSSTIIKLYYKQITSTTSSHTLYFTANSDYTFNSVKHNRSNTALEDLESGIEFLIHSYDMDNRAYLQGLTGYYNQIEFPYINNLESEGDIVSIESATLYLYPVEKTFEDNQLPSDLRLYITDQNNVLEDYVYGTDGVTVQTGNLTTDINARSTYYSFDVTEFIRNNFGTWGDNRQKLLLSIPDAEMATTFNQVIFENNPEENKRCKLAIRFKRYNEK
ncbi:MAG: DUF4270 family protein [Bacteroides sp.]|nr:DUF4270 family protein [Bacteroides sp.]